MDVAEFKRLTRHAEGITVDFKRATYDFSGSDKLERERKRAQFVKDIISFFNTPREENAYIVLGVEKTPTGEAVFHGISEHHDDADLQGRFEGLIHPLPVFTYEPVQHEGKQYAVITIMLDRSRGPCVPTRDIGDILRRHMVYIRRSSRNSEAQVEEQRHVYDWFRTRGPSTPSLATGDATWDALADCMHDFNSASYFYILATTRLAPQAGCPAENLAHVDWAFVTDFDPNTDASGLLSACAPSLSERRALHRIAKGDREPIRPARATYWYFARGIAGRDSTLAEGQWRDWHSKYDHDLRAQFELLAKADMSRPYILLAMWTDPSLARHLDSLLSAANSCLGSRVQFVIVHDGDHDDYRAYERDFGASVYALPVHQVCHGLARLSASTEASEEISLPSSSGAAVSIDPAQNAWLAEDLVALDFTAGRKPGKDRTPELDFLRGHDVDWHDLGIKADVEREITPKIEDAIRSDLQRRIASRVNLFHSPGAGGTTVARRLLWNLHRSYPCFELRTCDPLQTVERFAQLVALTGHPILVLAEGRNIAESDLDALYDLAQARHIPFVLLQVIRRFQKPRQGPRSFYVDASLTRSEAEIFVHFLQRVAQLRRRELNAALTAKATPQTPFYFGLIAFERNFAGLDTFIADRLGTLGDAQRDVILFLSIAYYYGQRSIPMQMFARLLGLPASRPVAMERVFADKPQVRELLVEESGGSCRPSHYLVAEATLKFLLGRSSDDARTWRQSLSRAAENFASFCRDCSEVIPEDSVELARRVFVFRDNADVLGTERASQPHFSQLIDDIPTDNGRVEVLRHLTDSFPEEAHFWAHLGRFYSYRQKDFDAAVKAIERGIALSPGDHVLHHMKGMALRSLTYHAMSEKASIESIVAHAEEAATSFEEARSLNSSDEHGYISEAQMALRVMDYAGAAAKQPVLRTVAQANAPAWLREALQNVEDLLAQVRQNREGSALSEYEQDCRAKLEVIYGRHEEALQHWQNLLDRREVHAPPIRRQIVWTLLARRERDWSALNRKELERSIDLLRQNIEEEPGEARNLRLWMNGIRWLERPPTLDAIIEQVAYWKANAESLEATYYLYVLNMLQGLSGLRLAGDVAARALEESRNRSAYVPNRHHSFEWLGSGEGIAQLVHQSRLGDWDDDRRFYVDTAPLRRIEGVIAAIRKPEAGEIELSGGIMCFFVPGQSNHRKGVDENRRVTCFLGFSYDGPRAWSVENA